MKTSAIIFFFSLFAMTGIQAQMNEIFAAIKAGDANALGRYMDDPVEVCVLEDQMIYSKREAIAMVSKFFSNNRPTDFKEMHQGSSKGKDSKYTIGSLTTSSGTFRVYIFVKQSGNRNVIQEIRFDKG